MSRFVPLSEVPDCFRCSNCRQMLQGSSRAVFAYPVCMHIVCADCKNANPNKCPDRTCKASCAALHYPHFSGLVTLWAQKRLFRCTKCEFTVSGRNKMNHVTDACTRAPAAAAAASNKAAAASAASLDPAVVMASVPAKPVAVSVPVPLPSLSAVDLSQNASSSLLSSRSNSSVVPSPASPPVTVTVGKSAGNIVSSSAGNALLAAAPPREQAEKVTVSSSPSTPASKPNNNNPSNKSSAVAQPPTPVKPPIAVAAPAAAPAAASSSASPSVAVASTLSVEQQREKEDLELRWQCLRSYAANQIPYIEQLIANEKQIIARAQRFGLDESSDMLACGRCKQKKPAECFSAGNASPVLATSHFLVPTRRRCDVCLARINMPLAHGEADTIRSCGTCHRERHSRFFNFSSATCDECRGRTFVSDEEKRERNREERAEDFQRLQLFARISGTAADMQARIMLRQLEVDIFAQQVLPELAAALWKLRRQFDVETVPICERDARKGILREAADAFRKAKAGIDGLLQADMEMRIAAAQAEFAAQRERQRQLEKVQEEFDRGEAKVRAVIVQEQQIGTRDLFNLATGAYRKLAQKMEKLREELREYADKFDGYETGKRDATGSDEQGARALLAAAVSQLNIECTKWHAKRESFEHQRMREHAAYGIQLRRELAASLRGGEKPASDGDEDEIVVLSESCIAYLTPTKEKTAAVAAAAGAASAASSSTRHQQPGFVCNLQDGVTLLLVLEFQERSALSAEWREAGHDVKFLPVPPQLLRDKSLLQKVNFVEAALLQGSLLMESFSWLKMAGSFSSFEFPVAESQEVPLLSEILGGFGARAESAACWVARDFLRIAMNSTGARDGAQSLMMSVLKEADIDGMIPKIYPLLYAALVCSRLPLMRAKSLWMRVAEKCVATGAATMLNSFPEFRLLCVMMNCAPADPEMGAFVMGKFADAIKLAASRQLVVFTSQHDSLDFFFAINMAAVEIGAKQLIVQAGGYSVILRMAADAITTLSRCLVLSVSSAGVPTWRYWGKMESWMVALSALLSHDFGPQSTSKPPLKSDDIAAADALLHAITELNKQLPRLAEVVVPEHPNQQKTQYSGLLHLVSLIANIRHAFTIPIGSQPPPSCNQFVDDVNRIVALANPHEIESMSSMADVLELSARKNTILSMAAGNFVQYLPALMRFSRMCLQQFERGDGARDTARILLEKASRGLEQTPKSSGLAAAKVAIVSEAETAELVQTIIFMAPMPGQCSAVSCGSWIKLLRLICNHLDVAALCGKSKTLVVDVSAALALSAPTLVQPDSYSGFVECVAALSEHLQMRTLAFLRGISSLELGCPQLCSAENLASKSLLLVFQQICTADAGALAVCELRMPQVVARYCDSFVKCLENIAADDKAAAAASTAFPSPQQQQQQQQRRCNVQYAVRDLGVMVQALVKGLESNSTAAQQSSAATLSGAQPTAEAKRAMLAAVRGTMDKLVAPLEKAKLLSESVMRSCDGCLSEEAQKRMKERQQKGQLNAEAMKPSASDAAAAAATAVAAPSSATSKTAQPAPAPAPKAAPASAAAAAAAAAPSPRPKQSVLGQGGSSCVWTAVD